MRGSRAIRVVLAATVATGCCAAAGPAAATFPGANGKIVFSRDATAPDDLTPVLGDFSGRSTFSSEIWVADADGGNQTRLTTSLIGELQAPLAPAIADVEYQATDFAPVWSPDGAHIAYSSNVDTPRLQIVVMNADGSGKTALTDGQSEDAFEPAWSPDGKRILYSNYGDSDQLQLWVMNADGSGSHPLIDDALGADWSPDGKRIAFTSVRSGAEEIYVAASDGSGAVDVSRLPNAWDYSPTWSPDGTQIAFESIANQGDPEIYSVPADRSAAARNLTRNAATADFEPRWSPDGTKILFVTDRTSDGPRLWVMDPDGANERRLVQGDRNDWRGDWQVRPGTLNLPSATGGSQPAPSSDGGNAPGQPAGAPPAPGSPSGTLGERAASRSCVVPSLRRKTLAAAKRVLARAGCRLGRISRKHSRRVRKGRIAAQRPAAGTRLAAGSRVAVVVSRGRR